MLFLANLNWLAILVASLVSFVSGAIWFGPKTFFPVWWKAMGKEPSEAAGSGSNMAVVFGATYLGQLFQVTSMAMIIAACRFAYPGFSLAEGLTLGIIAGVGLIAASSLSHRLFGGQGFKVWLIEVGSDAINIVIASIILTLWF